MENKEESSKATTKKVRPIHDAINKVLRCPYRDCTKSWSMGKSGEQCMSRHMKLVHRGKGHPLKPQDGIATVIRMHEKYVDPAYAPDSEESKAYSFATEDQDADDIPAEEVERIKDGASASLNKLLMNFVGWEAIEDEKFPQEIPYPTFAKAMMKLALKNGIFVKTSLTLLCRSVAATETRLSSMEKTMRDFNKHTSEIRGDMTKMTEEVFKRALDVEEAATDVKQANYLRESFDLRTVIERDASLLVKNGLGLGLKEFESAWTKKTEIMVRNTVHSSLRSVEQTGLPAQGGLSGAAPALMLEEDVMEDRKMNEASDMLASRASKLAKRQLDAATTNSLTQDQSPPKKKKIETANSDNICEVIFEDDEIDKLSTPQKRLAQIDDIE